MSDGCASNGPENGPTGLNAAPDPELVAAGWLRRNLSAPDRIDEARELYESLGFEVRVESLQPENFGSKCGSCAEIACQSYVLIYTRKR